MINNQTKPYRQKTQKRRRLHYISFRLVEKVEKSKRKGIHVIKTYDRAATIIPEWIGITFLVYNGKKHIPVHIEDRMVGKKLGEFSPTRTFNGHGSNRKK